ncbi:uncharacterized protein LOC134450371 [Engraulis encrasicolus]|uniref:uncharacterized protein LOC134450371 n=1 Tax=Engraulis encrasicolus TaxID=184585 RepID=UPI002FD3B5BC
MDGCKDTRRVSRVTLKETQKGSSKDGTDTHAPKEAAPMAVPLAGRRVSKQVPLLAQGRGLISLKGLLTAQKFSKGLKERAVQKLAAKKGIRTPAKKLVPIVNEQVPTGCAQPKEHFPAGHFSQLVQHFLASRVGTVTCVDAGPSSGPLAMALSEELRTLARSVCPPRYRLVCMVSLGPAEQEGVTMASRCLWDSHADTYISHTAQTDHVHCVATVFAVYYE